MAVHCLLTIEKNDQSVFCSPHSRRSLRSKSLAISVRMGSFHHENLILVLLNNGPESSVLVERRTRADYTKGQTCGDF